jgi:hypothetical protein
MSAANLLASEDRPDPGYVVCYTQLDFDAYYEVLNCFEFWGCRFGSTGRASL